jgi:hypothetical protein
MKNCRRRNARHWSALHSRGHPTRMQLIRLACRSAPYAHGSFERGRTSAIGLDDVAAGRGRSFGSERSNSVAAQDVQD